MAAAKNDRKYIILVVQRYGLEVNGGAELHCRWIAGHLSKHFEVEVLTTTALDYLTWSNHYPANRSTISNVTVERYRIERERDFTAFGAIQDKIFYSDHSAEDELKWLEENGPVSAGLLRALKKKGKNAWAILFWSYRYWLTFHGMNCYPRKSILLPTAEKDPLLKLPLFKEELRTPAGHIFLTQEERDLVRGSSGVTGKPDIISACGIDIPSVTEDDLGRFRHEFGITKPYFLYVGRVDRNKGCRQMFEFYKLFKKRNDFPHDLLLLGTPKMKIPEDESIRALGFVDESVKNTAIAGADLLIMPSFYESLSIILLEAWAQGCPSVVNGQCEVLRGQTLRSGAGLYYTNYTEFEEAVVKILTNKKLRARMSEAGRAFINRYCNWERITDEYTEFINRIGAGAAGGERA